LNPAIEPGFFVLKHPILRASPALLKLGLMKLLVKFSSGTVRRLEMIVE